MNKSYSKIRHIQESNIKLEKRLLKEQDFKNAMSDFANKLGTSQENQNIEYRVGKTNYDAIQKIASDYQMTKESSTDGTYFKWVKDLGDNNKLVLIVLNNQYKPHFGGVTAYVDRDNGEYLKADSGKLVKTGKGNMGTYPSYDSIDQLGLEINNKPFGEQKEFIDRLKGNINKYISAFNYSQPKSQSGATQTQQTGSGSSELLKLPVGPQIYYQFDKNKNSLVNLSYSKTPINTTNFTVKSFNMRDDLPQQIVYISNISGNDITLSNSAGDIIITKK